MTYIIIYIFCPFVFDFENMQKEFRLFKKANKFFHTVNFI
jgi:hypothetical protein